MKINTKITLTIGLLSVIGVTVGGPVYYLAAKQAIDKRIQAQLESVLALKENQLNEYLGQEVKNIQKVAKNPFVADNISAVYKYPDKKTEPRLKIQRYLTGTVKDEKDFYELFLIGPEGRVYLSTDEAQQGKIKSSEPYFTEGRKATTVQSFFFDTSLQQPATMISTPVKIAGENAVMVLAGRVNLENISRIMMERSGLGESGETYLVNKFNYLVSQSRFLPNAEFKETIFTKGAEEGLAGKNGFGYYTNYAKTPVLGGYAWIPEREMVMLAEISRKEALKPIVAIRTYIIILSLFTIIVVVVLGYFLSEEVTRPIKNLREAAIKIGGENDLEKAEMVKVCTKDEVGDLTIAFNTMLENLKLSRQKEKELAEAMIRTEKLSALGKLTGAVGHELRNPLGVIRNSIYFLRMKLGPALEDEKVKKHLDILDAEINTSDRIITDILTFGRIKEPQLASADVNNIIKRSVAKVKLPENVEVVTELAGDLPQIQADETQLIQVFSNLVLNGVEAMPQGGKITITGLKKAEFVEVGIADTGSGISAEDLKKIFEPLFSTKAKGTGLGLSVCQSIIEVHKGKLEVESEVGQGTKFTARLPIN